MARAHVGHDRHLENVSRELIQMSAGTTLVITRQSRDRVFSPRVAKVISAVRKLDSPLDARRLVRTGRFILIATRDSSPNIIECSCKMSDEFPLVFAEEQ